MDFFLALFVLGFLFLIGMGLVAFVVFLKTGKGLSANFSSKPTEPPDVPDQEPPKLLLGYTLRNSLVSPAEKAFLSTLDSVLPVEIRIFAKVRLADIFLVERSINRSAWQTAFNRIDRKHVDFLLCRADDLAPLLAIELDDSSHERKDRQERDEFVNELFASTKIKLLRFPVQHSYDLEVLVQRLNEGMQPDQTAE